LTTTGAVQYMQINQNYNGQTATQRTTNRFMVWRELAVQQGDC